MTDTNRIGCPCWYRHNGEAKAGTLRMWSYCGDDDSGGPVAVVEDAETLSVTTVDVDFISFASIPPWPKSTR